MDAERAVFMAVMEAAKAFEKVVVLHFYFTCYLMASNRPGSIRSTSSMPYSLISPTMHSCRKCFERSIKYNIHSSIVVIVPCMRRRLVLEVVHAVNVASS